MPSKKLLSAIVFIAISIGLSPAALRADTFNWTDVGPGITLASGTISATSIGGGEYVVNSGSGTFNGTAFNLIAGLDNGSAQISPSGLFIYDNVLFLTSNPTLDVDGLLFASSLGSELNIWGNGTPGSYSTYTEVGGSYNLQDDSTVFSISPAVPAPEPSAILLLGAGLVAMMIVARRRQPQPATAKVI